MHRCLIRTWNLNSCEFSYHVPYVIIFFIATICQTFGADPTPGDRMISKYFSAKTDELTQQTADRLAAVQTVEDWSELKKQLRTELCEMLGLEPLPEKTDLKPVITGTTEHEEFTVENLHFQSQPHLYVTGNLYVPKNLKEKAPAILYVCGHAKVKKNGISYGNKTSYQHHGGWFARNGYVCLTIDSLQLGEIEGMHHGTYKYDQWWWNARGYCPAGVEAWNCIRALDYLQSRPEVDGSRLGVTGRSGGGAYSWWVGALDDRIKVAVPVAGITSLHNHVVDGAIEGHCDCMFHVNTYRWDYPLVAALLAPRPLLISNTDKDEIFPLDGVYDVYSKVRPLYDIHEVPRNLGLQITEGPHKDTQELRMHAFHWFNKFLKNQDPLIEMAARKLFTPEQLRVFGQLPADEINTTIQNHFVEEAKPPAPPKSSAEFEQTQKALLAQLKEKSFRGWPVEPSPLKLHLVDEISEQEITLRQYQFQSEPFIDLDLYVLHRAELKPADIDQVILKCVDQAEWDAFLASMEADFPDQFGKSSGVSSSSSADDANLEQYREMVKTSNTSVVYFAPRGVGPTAFTGNKKKQTHIRRRFMQLGQTLDGMQVWDIRRAIQALRATPGMKSVSLSLQGKRNMAGNALYASLFERSIASLELWNLPTSHREGPIYLNVLRLLDIPQAVAMACSHAHVKIYQDKTEDWEFPKSVAKSLDWEDKRFQVRLMKDN